MPLSFNRQKKILKPSAPKNRVVEGLFYGSKIRE
jgi:hypothetical protein